MRFGVCCGLADAPALLKAGFHYVEFAAAEIAAAEDLAPYRELPIEATNVFFSGGVRLLGEDASDWRSVAAKTIERVASLGVKRMVVGSGAARRAPEGFDGDPAFVNIVAEMQVLADGFGVRLAPESLNHTETNVGNDLGTLALALADRGLDYTADSFHVLVEWRKAFPDAALPDLDHWREQMPTRPLHCHLGDLPRHVPDPADPMLAGFVDRLAELGYDDRVSLECNRAGLEPEEIFDRVQRLFAR